MGGEISVPDDQQIKAFRRKFSFFTFFSSITPLNSTAMRGQIGVKKSVKKPLNKIINKSDHRLNIKINFINIHDNQNKV
jgi:AMMECR1 domain-containing protein